MSDLGERWMAACDPARRLRALCCVLLSVISGACAGATHPRTAPADRGPEVLLPALPLPVVDGPSTWDIKERTALRKRLRGVPAARVPAAARRLLATPGPTARQATALWCALEGRASGPVATLATRACDKGLPVTAGVLTAFSHGTARYLALLGALRHQRSGLAQRRIVERWLAAAAAHPLTDRVRTALAASRGGVPPLPGPNLALIQACAARDARACKALAGGLATAPVATFASVMDRQLKQIQHLFETGEPLPRWALAEIARLGVSAPTGIMPRDPRKGRDRAYATLLDLCKAKSYARACVALLHHIRRRRDVPEYVFSELGDPALVLLTSLQNGDPRAMNARMLQLARSKDLQERQEAGRVWARQICARGGALGCSILGYGHFHGALGLDKDLPRAARLARGACLGGEPGACNLASFVAFRFKSQEDTPALRQARVEAAAWAERGCALQGQLNACHTQLVAAATGLRPLPAIWPRRNTERVRRALGRDRRRCKPGDGDHRCLAAAASLWLGVKVKDAPLTPAQLAEMRRQGRRWAATACKRDKGVACAMAAHMAASGTVEVSRPAAAD